MLHDVGRKFLKILVQHRASCWLRLNRPSHILKFESNSYSSDKKIYRISDARSTCLDRGGDLLAITTEEERSAIQAQVTNTAINYFWISLNDRDYIDNYYWSNNDANGLINWESGAPDLKSSMKII